MLSGTNNWPTKRNLFGVQVSVTDYEQCERIILNAAALRQSGIVTHLPVHGIVTAARDEKYRSRVNSFDIVAPDGQPVRWALNLLFRTDLTDRVYGPDLMLRLCRKAAQRKIAVYLYGSAPDVVERLSQSLRDRCPGLNLVGVESPPFRTLSEAETEAVVKRINDSGAGLVFIGLGCPRQDVFAHQIRDKVRAIQLCVGAAFDFHAGNKKTAPAWMQKRGLEWLYRLVQEPGRLWRRYLVTNSIFMYLMARHILFGRAAAT